MGNIFVNTRSSIKITGTKTIYFDPLEIEGSPHDADMVFITHEHYDHFSPEDMEKVIKSDTQIIVPMVMFDMVKEKAFPVQAIHGVLPLETRDFDGVRCQGIPAYNMDKPYHPKSNHWLGYLVKLDGKRYYVMGDTDATEEAALVHADVIFVPIGGKYTMDEKEAAEFINKKRPRLVVPTHFGETKIGTAFIQSIGLGIGTLRFW